MTRAGPPTRKDRREQIRRDLLAAATRVFAAKGLPGCRRRRSRCGYTTGAVYSNFAGEANNPEVLASALQALWRDGS